MIARSHTATARALHTAIAWPFYTPRPFHAAIGQPRYVTTRACRSATAEFTILEPDGTVDTKDVSIKIGDPGEAYVMIPAEVGRALQAGSRLTNSPSALPKRPDRFALSYFHDTQHFALDSSPSCPRLVIPQQLPRQSAADTSPATLYLFGVMHQIALDGTADAGFAQLASTIDPGIEEALERLKDM